MFLVLDAFTGSWDTAGMTLRQISDCSVGLIQGLVSACPSTPTAVIWACDTPNGNQSCLSDCLRKG